MPLGIGARIGVNEILTSLLETCFKTCSISGVCWWIPPNLYELRLFITSEPNRLTLADLPAPVVPEAATARISSASIEVNAGAIESAIAVA